MPRPAESLPSPPPSLDRRRAAELARLTETARRRQQRQLAEAIDRAFEHIPLPLRGAARRALGA
jgi:hypothetical protein